MRLTKEQHAEIRALWATGNFKKSELATQFGVSHQSITKIINKPTEVTESSVTEPITEVIPTEPSFRGKLAFLSNMSTYPLQYKGNHYESSEVLYHVLCNPEHVDKFTNLNGYEAKKLARRLRNERPSNDVRLKAMTIALRTKYTQHKDLLDKLAALPDEKLVEWNTWLDEHWGKSTKTGTGENYLGRLHKYFKYLYLDLPIPEDCKVFEQYDTKPEPEEPKPKKRLKFAFIGSRALSEPEYEAEAEVFFQVAYTCATLGIGYRSGGALGADYISELAYRTALDKGHENDIEIYVPNSYFRAESSKDNPLQSYHVIPNKDTYEYRKEIIKSIHPAPNRLTSFAMALHCRSVNQLCGDDLESNVDAVVCWTKDGKTVGDTATAINLAGYLDIPVFNLGANTEDVLNALEAYIEENQ